VEDIVTLPTTIRRLEFSLNRGFRITDSSLDLERIHSVGSRHARFRVNLAPNQNELKITYRGKPAFSGQKSLGGMPQGVLTDQGAYLDGNSAWYPLTSLPITRIDLDIRHPADWEVLSVGRLQKKPGRSLWSSSVPHDDLYLIAGPFKRYVEKHGDIDLSVWLLGDDRELAEKYLALMGGYLDHYSELIGAYPFAKFAVVENPWQTGFGMPSFTLLGSRVLRLPFIPYTSLPHEIVHNWLGNGIWIDYRKGNWSEGLTAYLADHWMKERRGQGAQHRLKSLQRLSNFADEGKDKPLLEFVSRHDDTSQAIGYDKSMMLFHMLRREIGDAAFRDALQRLWSEHQFQRIGFQQAVQTLLGKHPELMESYLPWLQSAAVPRIRLLEAEPVKTNGSDKVRLVIEQKNPDGLHMQLPVYVTSKVGEPAKRHLLNFDKQRQTFLLEVDEAPLRIDIDPAFDLLRHLDPSEQAPALNQLFSKPSALLVPTAAGAEEQTAWRSFAAQLKQRYPELLVFNDDTTLPVHIKHRLILGWNNRHLPESLPGFSHGSQQLTEGGLNIGGRRFQASQHAIVLVSNDRDASTTGFIGTPSAEEIAPLASKLPHYGSFGRMVFEKGTVKNLLRDQLSPRHSRLSQQFGDQSVPLVMPAEPVL